MEKEEQKSTEKRSGKTRPIHDDLQDEKRFYCKNCSSHFARKDSLEFHKKYNCCQELRRYICKDCNKGFYSNVSVREHYYKDNLGEHLHFCKKCNKGFAHNSQKSTHIKSRKCPNKDGPNQFRRRADFDEELEKSFKCKDIAIPVPVQQQQQPDTPLNTQVEVQQEKQIEQQENEEENASKVKKDRMINDAADPHIIDMGNVSMIGDSVVTSELGVPIISQVEITGEARDILMQMSMGGGSLLNIKDETINVDYDMKDKEHEDKLHLELEDDD